MWDTLRQMVRGTPGDSRHRGRRHEEAERETVGDSRETIGETRPGAAGRVIIEAMLLTGEQARSLGHVGRHGYRYRGAAPSNSHAQSTFPSDRSWNFFRSRRPRYEDPTPPRDCPPASRYPFLGDGRRSTSSRSGSVASVPHNQHNRADSRRQTAASRSSGRESRSSVGSVDGTNYRFYTSREALLSPRTSHEGTPRSSRASPRRQSHRRSLVSPERPRTSSSRASGSGYSS